MPFTSVRAKFKSGVDFINNPKITIDGEALDTLPTNPDTEHRLQSIDEDYEFPPELTSDILADIEADRNCLLIGHCGSGKSSLIQQIAARINQPCLPVNANNQMTISDFVGTWTVKGGETVWVDGILPWCMKHGVWLILDEIDIADPSILAALHGVLEPKRTLTLKEKGNEVVIAHKNFRFFATANTAGRMSVFRHLYQGTNIMNEASLDRFGSCHYVEYLKPDVEALVLKRKMSRVLKNKTKEDQLDNLVTRFVDIATEIRKAFTDEQIATNCSTRRLIDLGVKFCEYINKEYTGSEAITRALRTTIYNKITAEDEAVISSLAQRFFGI